MPITPTLAMHPDSADARLLTELSSYADDLSDASSRMELALDAGTDSPLWPPLTGYAVVAYMRAFALSNVRPGLITHLEIPEGILDAHAAIRSYRNTTIAHSQSELSLAKLTEHGRLTKVVPLTVRHQLPAQFLGTIDRVGELVDNLVRPLAERLTKELSNVSPEVINNWPVPELIQQQAEQFSAASRRGRQPRFTLYWDIHPGTPTEPVD